MNSPILKTAAFLATTLLLGACQPAAPGACQMARATDIPLSYHAGHLFSVPLVNGQPTNMVLDTGAQMTTLTKQGANRLSLHLQALPGFEEGLGGRRGHYGFEASSFQIGTLQGKQLRLMASDMVLPSDTTPVDGLLGSDFLAAYDLDLNLKQHKATLFRTFGDCSHPVSALDGQLFAVPLTHPRDINDWRPHILIEIAGRRMVALLDSGSPMTALFRDAARRVGLDIETLAADPHSHVGGIGPRSLLAVRHVLTPITVGDLLVANLPVAILDQHSPADTDVLLGLDFMSRVHTWFSFSSRTVILQYPALASPAP